MYRAYQFPWRGRVFAFGKVKFPPTVNVLGGICLRTPHGSQIVVEIAEVLAGFVNGLELQFGKQGLAIFNFLVRSALALLEAIVHPSGWWILKILDLCLRIGLDPWITKLVCQSRSFRQNPCLNFVN